MQRSAAWVLSAVAAASLGCSSGPSAIAFENRTFYEYGLGGTMDPAAFEKRYPPLDLAAEGQNPDYIGVSILGSTVRISRPKNWVIRAASNQPGARYIQYVSRNQYIVALWERPDFSSELWRDVLARYEEDAKTAGAELIGGPVPMATWNAQGRAYVIRRPVQAAKAPMASQSHEYIVRSERRVILVQIVHPEGELPSLSDELVRVIKTMQVD